MKTIAISGKKGSGKTTVAYLFAASFSSRGLRSLVLSLSDPLYKEVLKFEGVSSELPINTGKRIIRSRPNWPETRGWMQKRADEVKEEKGILFFANSLKSKRDLMQGFLDVIIVDDIRYQYEIDCLDPDVHIHLVSDRCGDSDAHSSEQFSPNENAIVCRNDDPESPYVIRERVEEVLGLA